MHDVLSLLAEARTLIDRQGYAFLAGGENNGPHDQFHYTLGLVKQGLPELVIVGMPEALAHQVLEKLAKLQIKQGPLTHGQVVNKEFFEGDDHDDTIRFQMVELNGYHAENVLSLNRVVNGTSTRLRGLQICYPDSAGRFPWEQGSEIDYMKILGSTPT